MEVKNKYVITSDAFTGKVDAWYNEEGQLCYFNMTGTVGSSKIMGVLLYQIPYTMKKLFKPSDISIFRIEEVEL